MVTGPAGTGKTYALMQKASALSSSLVVADFQRLLALTWMHGARRRLEAELSITCPKTPRLVTTIDGFALSLVNRYRYSLGYNKPIVATNNSQGFEETLFDTLAGYDNIRQSAASLLRSPTIKNLVRVSYPLIVLDEFQDCHGPLLDFVKELLSCSNVILAADAFQLLQPDIVGCPAIELVTQLSNRGEAGIEQLVDNHRTMSPAIIEAAGCIRAGVTAGVTIPVVPCPAPGIMAFEILDRLVHGWYHQRWHGQTAIICPSHVPLVGEVISSANGQLAKRGYGPISFLRESSSKDEIEHVAESVGVASNQVSAATPFSIPAEIGNQTAELALEYAAHIARLKGMRSLNTEFVLRSIEKTVHNRRAYLPVTHNRIITTVHGAKNREFDNVIIIWPYQVRADEEMKRKLLYNAITRAKKECVLLVQGDESRVRQDATLQLLSASVVVQKKRTKTKSTRPAKNKTRASK